jgi:hypothetical protein
MSDGKDVPVKDLILVPAVITLAITLLRLFGELNNWAPGLFGKEAGGGGSLVGISWLIPVFGLYFGYRLAKQGLAPGNAGKVAGFAVLALVAVFGLVAGAQKGGLPFAAQLALFCVASVAAVVFVYRSWPEFGKTVLAYALAARIPVVIVMLVAILGNWGTHYDVAPPNNPQIEAMSPIVKWFWIGVVPQMTVWIFMTHVGGAVLGALGAVVGRRR